MNKLMRSTSKWVLALLLATFVAGCGSDNSTPYATSNEITAYSLNGIDGVITEGTTSKTIDVEMPFGTVLSQSLIATYTTNGASVMIGADLQESGVTPNVFSDLVLYTVTAADGVSIATYEINVTVAANDAAVITTFSLSSDTLNNYDGIIDETALPNKTIDVVMPFGTNLTSQQLIATYVATGEVKIGADLQDNGVTLNDFLDPVLYTVTAADGVTIANYEVNVTVATEDAAYMTSYSLNGTDGVVTEDTMPKTIDVIMPFGTDLSVEMAATFSAIGVVKIDTAVQTSGVTENSFLSAPVIYTVTAADGVTTTTYNVYVTVGLISNPLAPELGEAGRFVILASQAITTTGVTAISNGDIAVEDQARSAMAGFTDNGSEGAMDELSLGMSYGFDDANPLPYPYPLKTATLPIGSEWVTTSAMITQAKTDLGLAYEFLASDPNPDAATQVCPIQLGGETLTRGVYKTDANVEISGSSLYLDAEGDSTSVFIFSIDGNLTTGAGGDITLIGGALAENVYFRTGGATIIAADTFFKGNIFAWSQINVLNNADITGRLFALTGQVTLIADTVTKP